MTTLLRNQIDITETIDRLCFPKEMWLGDDEWNVLLQHDAETTILLRNNEVIGQAITIPERAVADGLLEVDAEFTPHQSGVYSYSEAIIPTFQNKGYGKLLIEEIALRMREKQYTQITAHVRTRYGWNERRRKQLDVTTVRTVPNFWLHPQDRMVEFQTAELIPIATH